ncbi:19161_t:CDS:1 [Gigaspora margarita]|uniref:19161_t:CDS:1 n=1 Tax=Gigaspora margarita TaxID=4874 RepID=A0ABM8VY89_GIGMA|nr:19161_t:CDS:1 [Gigaspora margarita]
MALLQPPISSYTKASQKMWFTYSTSSNEFQHGLLGITDSYIVGNLCLQFPESEPLKAKQIEVIIEGIEYVRFSVRCGKHSKICEYEKKILNQSLLLWESNGWEKDPYEEITKENYPFQFLLPNDLPQSINLGTGHIYYKVKARINRKSNFKKLHGSEKTIECKCLITRYSPLPRPAPVQWIEWDDPNALNRGLSYYISMDYDTFGPENPIIVKLVVKLLRMDLNVKEIFIGLKENHLFRAENDGKGYYQYVQQISIFGDQLRTMLIDALSYTYKIDLHSCNVNWTTERPNINVCHQVEIKIKFGLFGPKDINLEREVNIANISNLTEIYQ